MYGGKGDSVVHDANDNDGSDDIGDDYNDDDDPDDKYGLYQLLWMIVSVHV